MTHIYSINCKFHFTSIIAHYDPDTKETDRRYSIHMNYGNEIRNDVKDYLDHYKWQKRLR